MSNASFSKREVIKFSFVMVIALAIMTVFAPAAAQAASSLSYDYSYQAIVKIYTYYQDANYNLVLAQTGSGVVMSQDGLILTNEHVVTITDAMDNELPTAFKICLTVDLAKEPNCAYTANLIAKDAKKDIALLRMKSLGFFNPSDLGFLEFAPNNSFTDRQSVTALGYPAAGGDTITVSKGVIAGTIEKYGLSWIKTDALVSFGSSGGALIDTQGRVLGITSAVNDDLGYVINVSSIREWVGQNGSQADQKSVLAGRAVELIQRQNKLKTELTFTNTLPKIELIRPENWEYVFESENTIFSGNSQNSDGGFVRVNWNPTELLIDDKFLETFIKFLAVENSCFASGNITLSGQVGKKVICPIGDEEVQQAIIGLKNYYVVVTYYYGKDKVDQYQVDTELNRLVLSADGLNYVEQKSYEQQNPYFKVSLPADWSLASRNSASQPFSASKKSNPAVSFSLYVGKLTQSQQGLSNQDYFNYIRDADVIQNQLERLTGLAGSRYVDSADYKINNELIKEIFYKYKFKDEDDGDKIKYYAAGYRVRTGDKVIIIQFDYLGESEQEFDRQLKDFEASVLVNFTLGKPVEQTAQVEPAPVQPETAKPNEPLGQPAEPTPPPTEAKAEAKTSAEPVAPFVSALPVVVKIQAIKNTGKRFIGRILLRVENKGEAWYLSPKTNQAHYLANGAAAYQLMREQGVGISNQDLAKIPVGLSQLAGADTDADGLTDPLEQALGTNHEKADTDGDGHSDKAELEGGYDPLKARVRMAYNLSLANRQKGKILLQVQSHGEAWYVNPKDGKRYFLGTADDAYQVMRKQSLGIAERDFAKL